MCPTKEHKGKFTKNYVTTLIPYIAEKGTIKVVPNGVLPRVPVMNVKGAAGGRMLLTNMKDFAGKDSIKFNGTSIAEGTKKAASYSSGVTVTVERESWTYTCTPSVNGQKNEKKSRKKSKRKK